MTQQQDNFSPIGAILNGPHWSSPVRLAQDEPHGTSCILIRVLTLDDRSGLAFGMFKHRGLVERVRYRIE
jgi:hypothetical protein